MKVFHKIPFFFKGWLPLLFLVLLLLLLLLLLLNQTGRKKRECVRTLLSSQVCFSMKLNGIAIVIVIVVVFVIVIVIFIDIRPSFDTRRVIYQSRGLSQTITVLISARLTQQNAAMRTRTHFKTQSVSLVSMVQS